MLCQIRMYISTVPHDKDSSNARDKNINRDHDIDRDSTHEKEFNRVDLGREVLDELHQAPYLEHLGYQKTITTTRKLYFWPRIKKDMVAYISKCQNF